ncbi:MAG: excinuclease ABC subunit UvrC [Firmicutes bacterium]|nr:excinuclease ABC subunit UvrC [Bacillota bacterium]
MIDLQEKLKYLPAKPGVYIMLNEFSQVLYVGKAKNLKNRVRQYFQKSTSEEKTILLVQKIKDFKFIVVNTETEALVLENNLIKEHKPFYNILLKDDKTYPYIKINIKDDFPRLEITRKLKQTGAKYFGPYMRGISASAMLEVIHSAFPLKSCKATVSPNPKKRECLQYHIGRCKAPCTGKISSADYKVFVKKAIDFLNGNDREVRKLLQEKMENASKLLEFELAMQYRNGLKILENLVRKQSADFPLDLNLDIFAYSGNAVASVINFTAVRGGKILASENFVIEECGDSQDAISNYIMQFYEKNPVLAEEIIVSHELLFGQEIEDYISHLKGSRVNLFCPKAGVRHSVLSLAQQNASQELEIIEAKTVNKDALTRLSLEELKEALSLSVLPKRIECYDISNISGTDKVASMVVFINGEASRQMYRRFKIKTVKGSDDFASLREAISRRVANFEDTDLSFSERPDLIVVDGGKGQLSSAFAILEPFGISVIGLAKREEEIFVPNQSTPILLSKDSLPLKLLQRLRDEAHRFAIAYHRALRDERQTRSNLTNIEGIGKTKARQLLMHFKKVENVAMATEKDIIEIKGFGKKDAENIINHFKQGTKD